MGLLLIVGWLISCNFLWLDVVCGLKIYTIWYVFRGWYIEYRIVYLFVESVIIEVVWWSVSIMSCNKNLGDNSRWKIANLLYGLLPSCWGYWVLRRVMLLQWYLMEDYKFTCVSRFTAQLLTKISFSHMIISSIHKIAITTFQ